MKKITELNEFNNNKVIDSLTDEERYEWYLRIKESLPILKRNMDVTALEIAIKEYELRHGIV
jgi:hypothetical protein